jgi:hypothetical protein
MFSFATILTTLTAAAAPLSAGVALLVGEPYGKFGALNPTGHAAVYLSNVCADTPVSLRLCKPGESGVVISRYHKVAGRDWIAIPLIPFLYGVERIEDIPAGVDTADVARIRNAYRRAHLEEIAPGGPQGEAPAGNWVQLIGAAYDRSIHGFALETTPEQDEALIAWLNSRPNKQRFNLLFRNCADFARSILNFYYPKAVRRSIIADVGITTPKNAAKALTKYARRNGLRLYSFVVPQVPGPPRSNKVRGVSESLVRSKKYVVPLALLEPWVAGSALAAYLVSGRFDITGRPYSLCTPDVLPDCVLAATSATQPALASSHEAQADMGASSGEAAAGQDLSSARPHATAGSLARASSQDYPTDHERRSDQIHQGDGL